MFPTNCRGSQPSAIWSEAKSDKLSTLSGAEFKAAFIARTRAARAGRFATQRQIAEAMGISLRNYEKYETRSCLPLELVPQFALITGVSLEYLFAWEEPKPRPRARRKARRRKTDNLSENRL